MKTQFTTILTILFLLMGSSTLFAKVWRVNNRDGVNADFTTAQAAHDAASAGDTLYFEHSASSYGDLTMTKGLKMFGTGFFLQVHPELQYNDDAATIGNIVVRPTATGTQISVNCSGITDSADGLSIFRIRSTGIQITGASNVQISECYINGGIGLDAIIRNGDNLCILNKCINILIRNNIINGPISQRELALWGPQYYPTNCNLYSQGYIKPYSVVVYNNSIRTTLQCGITGSFYNNIVGALATDAGSQVNNNVFNGTNYTRTSFFNNPQSSEINIFTAGNDNQFGKEFATIFTCSGPDSCYTLLAGSAPIGAGTGGTDAGAFGGISPYKLGMQPVIPAIYKLATEPTNNANSIKITVSTRTNN